MNLSNFNLTGTNNYSEKFAYNFSNRYFSDGTYNITYRCKDQENNTNTTAKNIFVSDITRPIVTIISPVSTTYSTSSADTYNVTISVGVNEPSNISYRIGTSAIKDIAFDSLSASSSENKQTGSYILMVYARDRSGNFVNKSVTFSVNARIVVQDQSATTTTTASGIVISSNQTTSTNKESEYWYQLVKDKKMDVLLENINFDLTKISFAVKKNISNVKLEVEMITSNIPVKLSNGKMRMYQYYSIKGLNETTINGADIIFRVKKSWLSENNIDKVILTRYKDSWSNLETTKLGEDMMYETFQATTPGFGYFAIVGLPPEPVIEKPTVIVNETQKPENTSKRNYTDISIPVKKKKTDVKLIMILLLVFATVSIIGIYSYKTITIPVLKYSDLTGDEKEKIRRYISIKLSTGEPVHKIETELINKGWSQDIVGNIIKTVEIPRSKELELEEFVERMLKLKNISKEDLKKALLKAGWQEEIVGNVLKRYQELK